MAIKKMTRIAGEVWRRARRIRSARRQRGAALLMAIATVGMIAAIAVELIEGVQDEIRLVEAFRDDFKARWAVQAPVAAVIGILKDNEDKFTGVTQRWATLNKTINVNGVLVAFSVQDESSKMNPNFLVKGNLKTRNIIGSLLKKVFHAKNLNDILINSLWDWVDQDSDSRATGSEGSYYKSLPVPYGVKNRPLDTLSELPLVRGFTDKALEELGFQKIGGTIDLNLSEWLTVFSEGKINLNTADPLIIRNLIDGLPEVFISELVARRKFDPLESVSDIKEFTGMNDTLFNQLVPLVTVSSKYFSVYSEAVVGRIRKRLTAVLKKDKKQVRIVYWRLS